MGKRASEHVAKVVHPRAWYLYHARPCHCTGGPRLLLRACHWHVHSRGNACGSVRWCAVQCCFFIMVCTRSPQPSCKITPSVQAHQPTVGCCAVCITRHWVLQSICSADPMKTTKCEPVTAVNLFCWSDEYHLLNANRSRPPACC